jgi:hypothetical protein
MKNLNNIITTVRPATAGRTTVQGQPRTIEWDFYVN